jgi:H+/Cl- antiporter ClcA
MLFALPLMGQRALRSRLPTWLKIAAAAGLVASSVSLFVGVYPIVDVVSKEEYAVKISSAVVISNMVGVLVYRWGRQAGSRPMSERRGPPADQQEGTGRS